MSKPLDGHCSLVRGTCLIVQERWLRMDPISDVFETMHVTSVVHSRLEATAPWGLMREAETGNDAAFHSAAAENLPSQFAHFGMVSRGNCWLSVGGKPDPLPLT